MIESRTGIFESHSVRNRPFRFCFPESTFLISNLDIFILARSPFTEHDKGSNLLGNAT